MQKEITLIAFVLVAQILLIILSQSNYRHVQCSFEKEHDYSIEVGILTISRANMAHLDPRQNYIHTTLASIATSDFNGTKINLFIGTPTSGTTCYCYINK